MFHLTMHEMNEFIVRTKFRFTTVINLLVTATLAHLEIGDTMEKTELDGP